MAEVIGGKGSPLPQVAKSLSPYIKTRQEALRIRRILSIYLASNIEGLPAGALSTTSLVLPGEDVQVKRIPSEVSGVRRSYLRALQAHAKARKEYAQLTRESSHNAQGVRQKERHDEEDSRESIATYLALTREQRKFEKLTILQRYLNLLSQKEAARPHYLRMRSILEDVAPPLETVQMSAFHAAYPLTSQTDIQALTTRLEKTVLCAKNALDHQRMLLAKVKKDQQSQRISVQTTTVSTGIEIDALSRTRDELISWIEEYLAKTSQFHDAANEVPTLNGKRAPLDIEKRRKEIQDRYEDYVEARKTLTALVLSRGTSPTQNPNDKAEDAEPQAHDQITNGTSHEASSVLPYMTEYLIPAANAQKSFLQQESHISSTLASQNKATVQVLDRLAEESHLLPNYPILTTRPRFHKVVTALRSTSSPAALAETARKEEESQILSQARQWAFAADAARSAKQKAVKERLGHGNAHINTAEGLVQELQEILGVGQAENEENEAEGDIWTESITTKPRKQGSSSSHGGVWAGLDGRVGIETDKLRKGS